MTNTQEVRVRFAPSPTGFLHVGGLRTALYNYLFAKRSHGKFILRIEDTDRSRFVEGATENLLETLRWVGLDFDEGPGKDGDCAPYIQSQRLALYRDQAEQLLDAGKAYRCFCTQQELDEMRETQQAAKEQQMYDRRCRNLPPEDIQKNIRDAQPFVIRLKIPLAGEMHFTDIIRGDVSINFSVIDDQVLIKSDGYPTYHLANVVDDHFMKITHVIRGEEWLPSTPKHILLYQAFGWTPPEFAHLPLLLNADKSKLSKRQGDVAVEDYRAKGYLREALLNFVALLGWHAADDRELYSLDELASEFSLDRVGKSGAVFDVEKLKWMNAQYLKNYSVEVLTEMCRPFLQESGFDLSDEPRIRTIVELLASRIQVPYAIAEHARIFLDEKIVLQSDEQRIIIASENAKKIFIAFLEHAESLRTWTREDFKALLKTVQTNTGIKGKDLYMPIRLAMIAQEHSPDLATIAEIFGKEKCLQRIRSALSGE